MTQRELIASALRKLGPERCEQGLVAFNEMGFVNFDRCFLGRAYGPIGALNDYGLCTWDDLTEALGMSRPEIEATTRAFDNIRSGPLAGEVLRAELRQMVEAEASKARVRPREAATV